MSGPDRPPRNKRLAAPDPRKGPELTEPELRAALHEGAALFDRGQHWHAHEAWEAAWHRAPQTDRDFYRGLIHAAAALVHHARGNAHGFERQRGRMQARLDAYGDAHRGVDLTRLQHAIEALPPPGKSTEYPRLALA